MIVNGNFDSNMPEFSIAHGQPIIQQNTPILPVNNPNFDSVSLAQYHSDVFSTSFNGGANAGIASSVYGQYASEESIRGWYETLGVKTKIDTALALANKQRQEAGLESYENLQEMLSDPNNTELVQNLMKETGMDLRSLVQADSLEEGEIGEQIIKDTRVLAWEQQRENSQNAIMKNNLDLNAQSNSLAKSSDSA